MEDSTEFHISRVCTRIVKLISCYCKDTLTAQKSITMDSSNKISLSQAQIQKTNMPFRSWAKVSAGVSKPNVKKKNAKSRE